MAAPEPQPAILICGLGKLGQACLRRLQGFDVALLAMDRHPPDWHDPELAHGLRAPVVIGDMRRAHHLRQAGATGARAVLLLSSESTVNLEAAVTVEAYVEYGSSPGVYSGRTAAATFPAGSPLERTEGASAAPRSQPSASLPSRAP